MKIFQLLEQVKEKTGFDILRPIDLELLKDLIMETEEFNGVIVFNVLKEQDENIKCTLMNPKKDKLNSVVNIYSIHAVPSLDGRKLLMIDCCKNTVIKN